MTCKKCGLGKVLCTCEPSHDVKYSAISYTDNFRVPESYADGLKEAYDADKSQYDDLAESLRNTPELTATDIRYLTGYVVMTVNTDTAQAKPLADKLLTGNFAVDKEMFYRTADGAMKWDKYHGLFTSDIPEKVAQAFNSGEYGRGVVLLTGRDPDTGEKVRRTYLRTVKAHLVAYLAGDRSALCMDRRVFRALKPLIRRAFTVDHLTYPDTVDDRMRERDREPEESGRAKPKPVLKHKTADDLDNDWWCDGYSQNEAEYRAIVEEFLHRIHHATGIPRMAIPMVLFNVGGDTNHFENDTVQRIQNND